MESAALLAPPAVSPRDNTWLWSRPACLTYRRQAAAAAAAFLQPTTRWFRYGRADSERSSAPHSPNGGVSEDAIPQFHLCVGVSVHGRDHGSAVPQLHVPLRRRPDLAGAHAPLHSRTVRARAAHPHLHPPGPEQRQTAHSAVAHLAARSHRQVSADMFISVCQTQALDPIVSTMFTVFCRGHVSYLPQVSCPRMFFSLLKTCQACQCISCLQMVWWMHCAHAVVFIFSHLLSGWLHTYWRMMCCMSVLFSSEAKGWSMLPLLIDICYIYTPTELPGCWASTYSTIRSSTSLITFSHDRSGKADLFMTERTLNHRYEAKLEPLHTHGETFKS